MITTEKQTVTLNAENFHQEVLESSKPVLVDFWAGWCGPCLTMAPVIEELAEEFDGKALVDKLEVEEHPQVASDFDIQSIPTLLFFKNGEVVDRVIGVVTKKDLTDRLRSLIAA